LDFCEKGKVDEENLDFSWRAVLNGKIGFSLSLNMTIFVKWRFLKNIHSLNIILDFIFFIDFLIDFIFVIDFLTSKR